MNAVTTNGFTMGLFQIVRDLLFGPADTRPDAARPVPPPAAKPDKRIGFRLQRRLPPLKYRSTLVRTPSDRESSREKPYRFAHRNARTGGWLDLSTDADPRWLEYYGLPTLRTPEQLAEWLTVTPGRLAWLTHRFNEGFRPTKAREAHYHFHWMDKRSGGRRLIESPKPLLKQLQQRILREILDKVPPHRHAHGFVTGRSIVTNARPHVGQRILLKLDLEDFYTSVRFPRVVAIFRSLGFSREVGIWLARLTTSSVPWEAMSSLGPAGYVAKYGSRHLPQGAPTSPALANLSAYSLDVRLSGLAASYDVSYTRYADDITFSGTKRFGGALRDFMPLVTKVIHSERLRVNRKKRKIVRNNQRQTVTGVVVNSHCNIARPEFDRLKAILTNCARRGPRSQNRENLPDFQSHLRGRVAHMMHLNPQRGAKLLRIYQTIDWAK
jgi:RNA-directed DNA polymerase